MDLVTDTDTSALMAVMVGEPERDRIVELSTGHDLIAPGSVPWEIGNAFSAMLKQSRIELSEALTGLKIFQTIALRYVAVDMSKAIGIAAEANIYAYDAYFIECSLRHSAPLMTLDRSLIRVAKALGVDVLE